ncbi:MAG TPA: outer membrane beta-barrel protein [Acidobacteriaceae bacterium]|jgi:hypothetical protein|nr:outer membrane beta-barrel protein [Acidobacteriaceae bacterium]
MTIRNFSTAFFLTICVFAGTTQLQAQVAPSAFKSPISLTAGGMVSLFDQDYYPVKQWGAGAFVDVNLFHGIGVEAEGRWQRFHEYQNISQDNYLIGPRVKVLHIWRAQPYVKVLGGFTNMTFENGIGTGRFTTLAFGGGVDLRVTRRWSARVDGEYQYWPTFLDSYLTPYGVSAGISYRIF